MKRREGEASSSSLRRPSARYCRSLPAAAPARRVLIPHDPPPPPRGRPTTRDKRGEPSIASTAVSSTTMAAVDQLFDLVESAAVASRPSRRPRQLFPPRLVRSGSFKRRLFAAGFAIEQRKRAYDSVGRRFAPRPASPAAGVRSSGRPSRLARDLLPAAKQSLMSDVDTLVRRRASATASEGTRNEQVGRAEAVEHGAQIGLRRRRSRPAACRTEARGGWRGLPGRVPKRAKRLFDRKFLARAFGENLVGVARQRFRHAADVVIGLAGEAAGRAGARRAGAVPKPHQAMLQHRKLVELVAAIVDEPFDQFGLDRPRRPSRSACGSPPRAGCGSGSAPDIGWRSPLPTDRENRRSRR